MSDLLTIQSAVIADIFAQSIGKMMQRLPPVLLGLLDIGLSIILSMNLHMLFL